MDIQRVETYMKRVAESETKTFTPVGDKLKVGLDLGTAYIVMVVLDEENNPIACEKQAADVLRDGVVVDYLGALNIVKALKAKLEKVSGKKIHLKQKTDPMVLAGLRVEMEGKQFDGTVQGRISDISKRLNEVVV